MIRSRHLLVLILFMVLLLSTLLVALNPALITVEFAWWTWSLPVGVALVVAVALGICGGVLLRGWWVGELLRERGRLRRALKSAEARMLASQQSQ